MEKINALLIIDAQNDFVLPTGNLPVAGADADMNRLASFITKNKKEISYIGMTLDSHHVIDISHPAFWQDKDGNSAKPFTLITPEDVNAGVWSPRYAPIEAVRYINELEKQGEYAHVIWPEHCIIGSTGAAIYKPVMDAVIEWSRQNRFFGAFTKGTNPLTEHFGAFRANVPIKDRPETQVNYDLINTLNSYRNIYFAGEAQSHCVGNSLKQAIEIVPDLAKKFVILTDCMSPVTGFETLADPIFEDAKKLGIRFAKSTDITL
jgi:nicotinamidase-related amidase